VFNRLSVQRALRIAQNLLKGVKKNPENGLVLFCGKVQSLNGRDEKEIAELLSPPLPLRVNSYKCDKLFHTEYVQHLFETYKQYGYAVVTSDAAYVGIAHGPRRTIPFKVDTNLATNTRRGGSSAARYGRIRDEQRHNYRKKLVDACVSYLQNVEGIVFAGNAELPSEIKEMVENDKRISVPILGLLKVSNEMSFDEIVERSMELIQTDDIVNEKTVITDIEDLIRRDPDMLVFGRDTIGRCVEEGLIHYVVVNDEEFPFDVEKRVIVHSTFLNPYSGVIGVLYYSGSSSCLDDRID